MFGLCAPPPQYTGKGQPSVLAPSMLGLVELVTGFLKSPAPVYVGKAQPRQTPGLLCSFLSAPQPAYVKAKPWRDGHPHPASNRTGAEGM
jgi:hypothetical protein